MPNRDYAVRSKNAGRSVNKMLVLLVVLLLIALGVLSLWALKNNAPIQPTVPTKSTPKNTLPTPPEEVYSYIRDLENREVPVDKSGSSARLTKEQEQLLQQQREEEKRRQELFEQQQAQVNKQITTGAETVVVTTKSDESAKKTVEEKRQAELKKQQEIAKREAEKKAQEAKVERESQKAKAVESTKVVSNFGLQCGSFKNRAQAENMQARLVMSGYHARITHSGEWNRVVVGPIGDRASAARAQANARSVAECIIIGM